MRKIERLKFIEKEFGKEFILPYRICIDEDDITKAVKEFESKGFTWGVRTDFVSGNEQGYKLPFVLEGTLDKTLKIFEEHGRKLVYILSHNVLSYVCNGVAIPHDREYVFFEVNAIDNVSQRDMYNNLDNLRRFFVGPTRKVIHDRTFYPCFKPEDNYLSDLRLLEIYNLMVGRKIARDIDEVTFSVRSPDKKVIIW